MNNFLKGFLATFICFCLANPVAKGQSVSSFKTEFSLPNSYDGLIISPAASFEFNKHSWSIGPTFLISYGDQIAERESFKLSGLFVGYDNYLHGKEEKLNLFFAIDLYLQQIKDEQTSQYFDTEKGSFQSFKIEQVDQIIQFYVSSGLLINLTKKLSLSQTIGTGVNGTFRSTSSPFNDFSDSFFTHDWLLKTGLIFKIK